MMKRSSGAKYIQRVQVKKSAEERKSDTTYKTDETDEVFRTAAA